MSFDLFGLQPKTRDGRYFWNNHFAWPSLWGFVCRHCRDELSKTQMETGYCHEGVEISSGQATLISQRLEGLLAKDEVGEADDYMTTDTIKESAAFGAMLKAKFGEDAGAFLYGTNLKDNVSQFAEFAKASGGFCIW